MNLIDNIFAGTISWNKTYPSALENIESIEYELLTEVNNIEICDKKKTDIIVCLNEAFSNAVIHGNKHNEKKRVCVKVDIRPAKRTLNITVSDEGDGFDRMKIENPLLPENRYKEGGRGIFLIQKLANSVTFNETGNEILIHFNI